MTRVMAELIDGKALAARVRAKVKDRIGSQNLNPGLAILLVGTDPASHTYVQKKQEACAEAGIHFEKFFYPEFVRDDELISKIQELNQRAVIHGILVQLPLPAGHDTDKIIAQIDPKKDVDGFHPENLERLKNGKPAMVSAVALAVMKLVDEAMKKTPPSAGGGSAFGGNPTLQRGGNAVIVSSDLFASPLVILLKEKNISATVVHPDALDADKTKTADILIVAAGKPHLITADHVKPGSIVIDVGTTKVEGKLLGDVDQPSVEPIAGALTPVPGGVGPMTVAMLLVNVLKACTLQSTKMPNNEYRMSNQ